MTIQQAMVRFVTPVEALNRLHEMSRGKSFSVPSAMEIADEFGAAESLGARIITVLDPDYPQILASVPGPPPVLTVLGNVSIFAMPGVAIIGARNASSGGRTIAQRMAEGCGKAGLCVVSGLARGIDAAAHRASLSSGTIAVLAGGIDCIYPPEHEDLAAQIVASGGLLVTEQPFGLSPRALHFPKRNRIISGLSLGVVVVEAAERSGTLITARAAADQGREVMAVPGSPLDPRCRGSNRLLRGGATLVEHAEDVVETIRPMVGGVEVALRRTVKTPQIDAPFAAADSETTIKVAELLSVVPIHIDVLARDLGLPVAACLAAIAELELDGRAQTLTGGYVTAV
jgi:DNA processing protein